MSAGQPRLVPAIGTMDGVNKEFKTPSTYLPGTTRVFHNGVLLDPTGDDHDFDGDGWTEESDHLTFTMNFAPRDGDTMFIYYEDETGGGAMSGGIPLIISAQVLIPAIEQAFNVRPELFSAGELGDLLPEIIQVVGLKPEMKQAMNLRPKMISAEVD